MKRFISLFTVIVVITLNVTSYANNKKEEFYDPSVVKELKENYNKIVSFIHKVIIDDEYSKIKEIFQKSIEETLSRRPEFKIEISDLESLYTKLNQFNLLLQGINPYDLIRLRRCLDIVGYGPMQAVLYRLTVDSKKYKDQIPKIVPFLEIYDKLSQLSIKIRTWDVEYLTYLFNQKYKKINFKANPIELFLKNKLNLFNEPILEFMGVNNREPILRLSTIKVFDEKDSIANILEIGILWNNFINFLDYKSGKREKFLLRYYGISFSFGRKTESLKSPKFAIGCLLYLDILKLGILYTFKENEIYFSAGLSKFDLLNFISKYFI